MPGRLCSFLPLALLAFWLWPTAQKLWAVFDEWHFHPSNALPAINPIWLHGWAIASLAPRTARTCGSELAPGGDPTKAASQAIQKLTDLLVVTASTKLEQVPSLLLARFAISAHAQRT